MSGLILVDGNVNFPKTSYSWLIKYTHPGMAFSRAMKSLSRSKIFAKDFLVVTSEATYQRVLELVPASQLWHGKRPKYNNLIGKCTLIEWQGKTIPLLAVPTFSQMWSRTYQVLYIRYMKKVLPNYGDFFGEAHAFEYHWQGNKPGLLADIEALNPVLISLDLETLEEVEVTTADGTNHTFTGVIDLVSVSAVYFKQGQELIRTWVFPQKSETDYQNLKDVARSSYPKVMHNGGYDMEYLQRWRVSMINYVWDTQDYFRSICNDFTGRYSLHDTHSIFCRQSVYWKELSDVKHGDGGKTGYAAYCEYAGWDAHNTAEACLQQIKGFEPINFNNYAYRKQFDPLAHMCQMHGFEMDMEENGRLHLEHREQFEADTAFCKAVTGLGPNQSQKLTPGIIATAKSMKALGVPEINIPKGSGKSDLDSLIVGHPVVGYIYSRIKRARSANKNVSTYIRFKPYYRFGDQGKSWLRFSMTTYVTLSNRFSCNSSAQWCGSNAQNFPLPMRTQFVAPEGYTLVSIDAPQSESFTTGFLSDCANMIKVLTDRSMDFHKYNASAIFQIPYDTVTKYQRKGAKPAGHGYNYGLTGYGLSRNMGVVESRALRSAMGYVGSLAGACTETFKRLNKLYPEVRGKWYAQQVAQVLKFGRLYCITGYAPIILRDPLKDKMAVNSIVSCESQNLSVHLNLKGGNKILEDIIASTYGTDVILIMQLHDELILAIRNHYTVKQVDQMAEKWFTNSTIMRSGKTMVIPVGIPVFGKYWDELKEDEIPRDSIDINMPIEQATRYWRTKHGA